jgi:hypothetical protein
MPLTVTASVGGPSAWSTRASDGGVSTTEGRPRATRARGRDLLAQREVDRGLSAIAASDHDHRRSREHLPDRGSHAPGGRRHFLQEDANERIVPELLRFLAHRPDRTALDQSKFGR